MELKGSEYAPGQIRIYVDGVLLAPGRTKFALHDECIKITTDPDDQTYTEPLEAPNADERTSLAQYVDYANGNDTNNGFSWTTANKTARLATAEEIERVRRTECTRQGHSWQILQQVDVGPVALVCGWCEEQLAVVDIKVLDQLRAAIRPLAAFVREEFGTGKSLLTMLSSCDHMIAGGISDEEAEALAALDDWESYLSWCKERGTAPMARRLFDRFNVDVNGGKSGGSSSPTGTGPADTTDQTDP